MRRMLAILGLVAMAGTVWAGTNNLPTETSSVIQRAHVNKFKTALSGDVVPRTDSGNVTTNAASLGSTTYKWLKAFITSGYWSVGDIKAHHSFNGAVGPGQGWMLMDGRQITQANYDAEHGAGSWATYVGSSPIANKYLPNITNRYPVGATTTTQDGSVTITTVGNSSHQVNLQHSHTVNSHNHQWYVNNSSANDTTFDVNGSSTALSGSGDTASHIDVSTSGATAAPVTGYTSSASPGTNNGLSATQSIQPESVQVQYYMRIVE